MPRKRATPRRNEGRVNHGRMVETSPSLRALWRRHLARVAALPCAVCGQPSTVHHVTASINGGRMTRSDERVAPLCPRHHQKVHDPKGFDPISVEGLGHGGFFRRHGIDLLQLADKLWAETLNEEE